MQVPLIKDTRATAQSIKRMTATTQYNAMKKNTMRRATKILVVAIQSAHLFMHFEAPSHITVVITIPVRTEATHI